MSYKSIFQAIKANNFEAVKDFTENRKVNKKSLNKAGYNIIEIAFYNRNKNDTIIEYLLDNDYPVRFESKNMQAIVFSIIKNDDFSLLKTLVTKGLPFNYTSIQGYTLLEFAFFYKSSGCLSFLQKHTDIKEDPFILIEKGEFLSLVKFLKKNKDYDIYFKKGYKTLLLQSLISRNLKVFIYLLKNFYSNKSETCNYIADEIKHFTVCSQYKNERYLKAVFKYANNIMKSISKITLLTSSVSNLHSENIKFIYNNLSTKDKKHVYSQFYSYYKTDSQIVIETLYDLLLQDKKNEKLDNFTDQAIHPAIFYLHKMNRKKYDYYLEKYPLDYYEKEKIADLAFENCDIKLVKEYAIEDNMKEICFYPKLIVSYLKSKKSTNIKFKFYKELKSICNFTDIFIDYPYFNKTNFYTLMLWMSEYKLFNIINKSENLKKENFEFSFSQKNKHIPQQYFLSFLLNTDNKKDHFFNYDTRKSKKAGWKPEDYMQTLISIINIFDIDVYKNVDIDFMTFHYDLNDIKVPNFTHPKKKYYQDISNMKILDFIEQSAPIDTFAIGLRSQLEKNHINKQDNICITNTNIEQPIQRKRL